MLYNNKKCDDIHEQCLTDCVTDKQLTHDALFPMQFFACLVCIVS